MNAASILVIPMIPDHWPAVRAIYESGIATGQATFQEECPSWEQWNAAHVPSCRLVVVSDGDPLGWAALTPVSGRRVYAGVGEVSIYIAELYRGKGLGKTLLSALVMESEKYGYWTLQAGIFPENIASLRLHESCGFRIAGRREKIGKMGTVWRDTLLMERRSRTVGW
ncbi:MAG TPA: GNAT family N-acetyltransferase [Chitinophagaceae bacterium]|nr:GNAT family N-acetyltransferase [Chitinophagaceae bacterium]